MSPTFCCPCSVRLCLSAVVRSAIGSHGARARFTPRITSGRSMTCRSRSELESGLKTRGRLPVGYIKLRRSCVTIAIRFEDGGLGGVGGEEAAAVPHFALSGSSLPPQSSVAPNFFRSGSAAVQRRSGGGETVSKFRTIRFYTAPTCHSNAIISAAGEVAPHAAAAPCLTEGWGTAGCHSTLPRFSAAMSVAQALVRTPPTAALGPSSSRPWR